MLAPKLVFTLYKLLAQRKPGDAHALWIIIPKATGRSISEAMELPSHLSMVCVGGKYSQLFKLRFLLIENTDLDIKPPVCYPIPRTNRSGIGISNLPDRSIGFIFAK